MAAAMVQGASRGIGLELVRQLLIRGETVLATSRDPDASTLAALARQYPKRLVRLRLDVEDESSVEAAADEAKRRIEELHLLMNVAGVLCIDGVLPEKKVEDVDPDRLRRLFSVNAVGPLVVAKHFRPLIAHEHRAVLANVSARVGSVGDNRLGGWYGYRASKAAQNMFTKNLSIELTRRAKQLVVVALHPGTVATDLSKPFQRSVPDGKLFEVDRAATQLLSIVDKVTPADNGAFFAWDGSAIPW